MALDLGRGSGPVSLLLTVVKILQKNVTDTLTDTIQSESPKFGTLSRSTDPSRWALLPKIF